ncbi:hypothetical protein [Defluviitalea saccharophila]|uniref:Cyclic lactone autoinducer peptide n=1 Tax=Defluviitalea saccharophila TaxID=879970 RepID=A0ABZ2Y7B0_9FIRM
MKTVDILRKYVGTAFAIAAFVVAQSASTQFSFIYYQDIVPEKVKNLTK